MKTLWISHIVPYPPKAGVLLRAYNLLKETAARHEVDLVAFVQEPWLRTIYGDVAAGLADCRSALGAICHDVHLVPIASAAGRFGRVATAGRALLQGVSYTTSWLRQDDVTRLVQGLVARRAHDLVHIDTIGLLPYRDAVGARPTTLGHHNIESHLFARRSMSEGNPAKRWYFSREASLLAAAERQAAARFNAHLTCSELDSQRLAEVVGPVRAHAVPNGVDCEYFAPRADPQKPGAMLFLGTLNWHPNSDAMQFFLTEVWPGLVREDPRLSFDIVGANAPQRLTELAAASPRVTMHGFVPDVRPYFAAAELFVCPIMDGGGTKLKLLDAFAMGKAVLAHPIALEGIDATPGVDVEVAETPAQFHAQILALMADPNRRELLGRNARKLAESRYSFAAIGSEFASLLAGIAREPARGG